MGKHEGQKRRSKPEWFSTPWLAAHVLSPGSSLTLSEFSERSSPLLRGKKKLKGGPGDHRMGTRTHTDVSTVRAFKEGDTPGI